MSSPRAGLLFAVTGLLLAVGAAFLVWQSARNQPNTASVPVPPIASSVTNNATITGAATQPSAQTQPAGATVSGALAAALRMGATPVRDTLQVVVAGMPQPYIERTAIPLSGDLMAEFAMVSGEDRYQRVVDIFIYRGSRDQPFDGATIKMTGEMRYMAHGYYTWVADPAGDGHYILSMPFNMPGEWRLTFQFDGGPKPTQVVLDLDLFY